MIETIEYKGKKYPKFQASGHASRFIENIALEVCKGVGLDIGCGKKEWSLPYSIPIDKSFNDGFDASCIPYSKDGYDYIFSSHCLEHLNNWKFHLDYWISCIRMGGILFLYLPDYSQGYWSYGNLKHESIFTPEIIRGFMEDRGLENIFVSGCDLNNSFAAMAEIP